MLEGGNITSASSSSSASENSGEDSSCEVEAEKGDLYMVRRLMGSMCKDLDDTQRENIFHSRCIIEGRLCSMIIDSGSCTNVMSARMVEVNVH